MKNTKEKSKFFRFFYKNFFNVTTIFWIIAIIIAIYFPLKAKSERELKYYCHPVKATVVKTGQTSSLEVFCDEEKIKSDVTAVQVAIWNNGKKSIKRDDILETITLYTEPKTPIIDAVVRKRTREVIKLSIDRSSIKEGFIPINWHILERNDGGIIQVIFAGSPDVEILAKGIIEGQKSIKQVKFPGEILSPYKQYEKGYRGRKSSVYIFSALIIINIVVMGFAFRVGIIGPKSKLGKTFGILGLVYFIVLFSIIIVPLIITIIEIKSLGPPFSF